ncbi:sensor histidine kinase [Catenuloplanes japonicus]|uniref:sensor histidine kinase n=1 Tax=Catenuloplanes japonicus TaxID=33876 RepID=UPI00068AA8F1|nr:sensor histidine kinase [Catenuloplanes japonicus]
MTTLRGQWPVVLLLGVLIAGDLETARGISVGGQLWAVPGALALAALTFAATTRARAASLAASAVVVLSSVLLWALGAITIAGLPLLSSEIAALMAINVAVVRQLPPGGTARLVVVQVAAIGTAGLLRPTTGADAPVSEMLPTVAVLLLASIMGGWYLRGRDQERRHRTEEAVLAAQRRERIDLARELHDVVAHHIGGVVVQAQAAQAVASADSGAAARVLPVIERAGTDALASMRRMVATLRDDEAGPSALAPADDLTAALHQLAASPGTPVTLTLDLPTPVPPEIATSVLRVTQESVTNARRHASGAREIAVTISNKNGKIAIRVRDDGRPGGVPKTYGGGYGLVGMRERVALLGGTLSAGRTPAGGWEVTADLPLDALPGGPSRNAPVRRDPGAPGSSPRRVSDSGVDVAADAPVDGTPGGSSRGTPTPRAVATREPGTPAYRVPADEAR